MPRPNPDARSDVTQEGAPQQTTGHTSRSNSNARSDVTQEGSSLRTDEDTLIPFFQKNGIKARKGVSAPNKAPLTEFERSLLSTSPLTDMTSAPDEIRSRVTLVAPRDQYRVGDRIQLRVDLYDGRGRIRTQGGDEVRMWLTAPSRNLTAVAAEVTDMRNGSYLGETTLQWAGVTRVRVSLTYPREFLRLVVKLRHTVHSGRWITATFKSGKGKKETTVCLTSQPVPGFKSTCNLTSKNAGIPWYCGRPTDPRLTCEHMAASSNLLYTPFSASPVEEELSRKMDREPFLRLIPTNITLVTVSGQGHTKEHQLPPCWSKPLRESWEGLAPRGWFQGGSWRPSTCSLPEMTRLYVQRCMRNTSMLLLGDSNMRHWWITITGLMNCSRVVNGKAWHAPRICESRRTNSSVHFAPHAMPFSVGHHSDLYNLPLPTALRRLEQRRNIVIVVHYYVHLSTEALHAYRDRVRAARQVIETYLDTHPKVKVKVIIRGPHVLYEGNRHHAMFGDTFGPVYIRMWKEEFRGLYDRVWFLNYWDMTIAAENMQCHPPESMILETVKVLFGYFCDKEMSH